MFADPEFLAVVPADQHAAFAASASPVYVTDRDTRLVFVNASWDRFARDNDGAGALENWGPGARVLDAIPEALKAFYLALYERVLGGEVVQHEYDCHAPDRYRRFRMVAYPMAGNRFLAVENSLLVEEDAEGWQGGPEALRREFLGEGGAVVQCAHCRRVRSLRDEALWAFVPRFVEARPEAVTHGLCPPCLEHYYPAAA